MKRFEDIGITVLKDFKVKDNTEELRDYIYEINDILFKRQKQYALYTTAERLRNNLIQYGIKIKNLEFKKPIYEEKRNEILERLRNLCNKLSTYFLEYNSTVEEVKIASQSIQKFQLSRYIKMKENLTTEEIIKLLKENKEISEDIGSELITQSFEKMQEELLSILTERYRLAA